MRSTSKPWIELQVYPATDPQLVKSIWAGVQLEWNELGLMARFRVEAPDEITFSRLSIPTPSRSPERRDDLWKDTCFECFVKPGPSEAYLEFNGSPSGDWNLYSFQSYRAGMKPVDLTDATSPRVTSSVLNSKSITMDWAIPIERDPKHRLQVGATMVLNLAGASTYWALSHRGAKPDFHLAASWTQT